MMTAKIFKNGRSQAVRLPKEYRFSDDEVILNKIGDVILLMPKEKNGAGFSTAIVHKIICKKTEAVEKDRKSVV